MDGREQRYERSSRAGAPPARATRPRPGRQETPHEAVLQLQRAAGNAAVARLLHDGPPVQRLVDRTKAQERVTVSEYKDVKARLEADGGGAMTTLYTGQFIRLASLFRKNRDSLNLLKSDPLEHLALSPYETQDTFVATKLHDEVGGFPAATQNKIIDNPAARCN